MTEISIIWDYSIAVHYFNSRRSNKSNETQLRNRSLNFKLESPKYIKVSLCWWLLTYYRSHISQTGHHHLKVVNNFLWIINIREVDVTLGSLFCELCICSNGLSCVWRLELILIRRPTISDFIRFIPFPVISPISI